MSGRLAFTCATHSVCRNATILEAGAALSASREVKFGVEVDSGRAYAFSLFVVEGNEWDRGQASKKWGQTNWHLDPEKHGVERPFKIIFVSF